VNGKSVKQLRKYGIKVKTGVLKKESLQLNKGFFSKFVNKRPHVTAKFGVSLDGKISLSNGTSKWITSSDSRKDVQEERASRSLIFTSSKTVLRDNPQMTIRDSILLDKISRASSVFAAGSIITLSPPGIPNT